MKSKPTAWQGHGPDLVRDNRLMHERIAAQDQELEQLRTVIRGVLASLKKWDGANDENRYADKFVWEAYDALKKIKLEGKPTCL